MDTAGSVTNWISKLKEGDSQAAQELWQRYCVRLALLAKKRLGDSLRTVKDEEDVVQEAFHSFYRRVQSQQFPQLESREDLWQILVVITARKVVNQQKHLTRKKRGDGRVAGESHWFNGLSQDEVQGIQAVVGDEPTPAFEAEVAEELERLLDLLGDDSLIQVVSLKLQGFTSADVAQELSCSLSSVERKLRLIRERWAGELATHREGQ